MERSQGATPAKEQMCRSCDDLRGACRDIEQDARKLLEHQAITDDEEAYSGQHDEMVEQGKLAVRAIEEARMRLGKIMQYADDGVSVFDKQ